MGAWGSRPGRLAHPSPRSKEIGLGAMGHSPKTRQEQPCALLQSQQSLLNIRHPQKSSLEIKANRFAPAHPKLWGIPQEQECYARARPGFSALMAGPRGRRWPILIKLIKPAPFKELQPHATRGEEENMKLQGKKEKSLCKHAPPKPSLPSRSLMDTTILEDKSPENELVLETGPAQKTLLLPATRTYWDTSHFPSG